MKDIIIIANSKKEAIKIANSHYPLGAMFVRKDIVYGSYQYTFRVKI